MPFNTYCFVISICFHNFAYTENKARMNKETELNKELGDFVEQERGRCMNYMRSRFAGSMSEDDMKDVFQDACVALVQTMRSRRKEIESHSGSMSGYLLAICFRMAAKRCGRAVKTKSIGTYGDDDCKTAGTVSDAKIQSLLDMTTDSVGDRERKVIHDVVSKIVNEHLSQRCADIFHGYYWNDHLSTQDIADIYGFSTDRVAITTHSRCVQKFIDFMKERFPDVIDKIRRNKR